MELKEKTVLFLHVPKAGGQSLNKVLKRKHTKEERLYLNGLKSLSKVEKLSDSEKSRLKLVHGHFPFGIHESLPQPCTYVTMLRNPVKRVISNYFYAKKSSHHRFHNIINKEQMSLEEYVKSEINIQVNNGQVRLFSGKVDVPYGKCTPEMLETAKSNLRDYFSIVGTLESFDKTLLALKKQLSYQYIFYTKANVAQAKEKKNQIDKKTKEIIEKSNILDQELYNYAIELQEEIFNNLSIKDSDLSRFQKLNTIYGWYCSCRKYFKGQLLTE